LILKNNGILLVREVNKNSSMDHQATQPVFILLVLALNSTTSINFISKQEYKDIINILLNVIIQLVNIPMEENGENGFGLIKQVDVVMKLGNSLFQRFAPLDNTDFLNYYFDNTQPNKVNIVKNMFCAALCAALRRNHFISKMYWVILKKVKLWLVILF